MRWKAVFGWIYETFSSRKCGSEWAHEKNNCAWHWVIDGAVTQDALCKYVWVKKNECKICGGPEKHSLYHCKWSKNLRFQMSAEVRAFEHVAQGDHKCWLWKNGNCVFPLSHADEERY